MLNTYFCIYELIDPFLDSAMNLPGKTQCLILKNVLSRIKHSPLDPPVYGSFLKLCYLKRANKIVDEDIIVT